MTVKKLPPQDILRELLDYDELSGRLTWRNRDVSHFSDSFRTAEGNCNQWNSRFAGRIAFTATDANGYYHGRLKSVGYLAHRVIFKWMTGADAEVVDHIDGDPGNNKWSNLRSVTQLINGKNRKKRDDCRHGMPGVSFTNYPKRPWRAAIGVKSKIIYLGCFETKAEAVAARFEAEKKHGFVNR